MHSIAAVSPHGRARGEFRLPGNTSLREDALQAGRFDGDPQHFRGIGRRLTICNDRSKSGFAKG